MDSAKATAKWGAACAACAAAKAKCIRNSGDPSTKCDRCARLFKSCTSQVHKPRKKRTSKPSKTSQLEERLNGLVDLLRATGELPELTRTDGPSAAVSAAVSDAVSPAVSSRTSRTARTARTSPQNDGPPIIPASYNSFAPPACICRPEAGEVVTAAVQSDSELLAIYRTQLFPLYPFVRVPDGVSAAHLAAERPFFFRALKTVASMHNIRSMQGQMYELTRDLADHLLLQSDRSLDLVQCLLIVVGWYHHHCMMHAQLNNMLHLAASLVADLGLNRPPRLAERTHLLVLHPSEPAPRTHEERRTLLGLWYISSSVALCFQKMEPMRFSPYLRGCLQELDDAHECPSDATVVALVRLQCLTERIAALNSRDDPADDLPGIPRASYAAYQVALQVELDRLCASFDHELLEQDCIATHIHTIRLRLYEPPPLDAVLLQRLSTSVASLPPHHAPTTLDVLHRTRSLLVAWFDHLQSMPVSYLISAPLSMCMHLLYAITMLSRWSCLVGPQRLPARPLSHPPLPRHQPPLPPPPPPPPIDIKDASMRIVPDQGGPGDTPASLTSTLLGTASETSSARDRPPAYVPVASVLPSFDNRELGRDPPLLAAVSQLRDQLRGQPELALDIPVILDSIVRIMDRCHVQLQTAGTGHFGDGIGVGRSVNIWELTARKISIMRAKLVRHNDAEGEPAPDDDPPHHGPIPTSAATVAAAATTTTTLPVTSATALALHGPPAIDLPTAGLSYADVHVDNWECTSLWNNDMFDSLDPGLWMDNMDWTATLASV